MYLLHFLSTGRLKYLNVFVSGVMMAARSLIQLFRAVNPALLHKKDRVRKLCTFI